MSTRAVPMLVAAQRASPFRTRQPHSLQRSSTRKTTLGHRLLSSHKAGPSQDSSTSLNLWAQIKEARPAVRYTVYAGLALMVTAESTFWFNVVRAKYFPSKAVEGKEEADRFLQDLWNAVKGYRTVWLANYNRYYGAYAWGLGYGGLDGLSTHDAS
jgi:hypothetical protein